MFVICAYADLILHHETIYAIIRVTQTKVAGAKIIIRPNSRSASNYKMIKTGCTIVSTKNEK
jgi:2-methylisocitrate lyase-like PEP mutase family enzyme